MTNPDVIYVVHRFPEFPGAFLTDEVNEVAERGLLPAVYAIDNPRSRASDNLPVVPLKSWDGSRVALANLAMRVARRHPAGISRLVAQGTSVAKRGRTRFLWQALLAADHIGSARPRRVHAHNGNEPAAVGWRLARILGIPFSFQVHGTDVFTQQFDLETHLRMSDVAIAPCEYFAEHLRWIAPGSHVVTIPVGVDPARFVRTTPWSRGAPPRLLSVGRLVEKNGLEHLIAAVAGLRARGVDTQATIIGTGPLQQALADQARQLGLDDVVRFLGSQPRHVVQEQLERATIFVLPCVVAKDGDRDSQPVGLKEAMAMEVPVVSTSVAGIPELVDPRCGMLAPPGDSDGLADAIATMLARSDDELRTMGMHGRERVTRHFSYDVTIPSLLQTWQLKPAFGGVHA